MEMESAPSGCISPLLSSIPRSASTAGCSWLDQEQPMAEPQGRGEMGCDLPFPPLAPRGYVLVGSPRLMPPPGKLLRRRGP